MLMGKRGESLTGTTYKSNPKIRESNWSKYFFLLVSKCSAASTSFLSRGELGGQDMEKPDGQAGPCMLRSTAIHFRKKYIKILTKD